jgi:molybdenum cofactor biosynthesis enzyme
VSQFSHLNEHGQAVMVDVSGKQEQTSNCKSFRTDFFIRTNDIFY